MYERINSINGGYRAMAYPLRNQQLHELYPGRLTEPQFHYSADNIPAEDQEGVEETLQESNALRMAYEKQRDALELMLGENKMLNTPFVEKEEEIQYPDVVGLMEPTLTEPFDNLNSKLDDGRKLKIVKHESSSEMLMRWAGIIMIILAVVVLGMFTMEMFKHNKTRESRRPSPPVMVMNPRYLPKRR